MTLYLAKRGNGQIYLSSNEALDDFFSNGFDIYREDESGNTLIATNGEWLEPKPDIEHYEEHTFELPPNVTAQIRQNSADVAYISMMTGVDL